MMLSTLRENGASASRAVGSANVTTAATASAVVTREEMCMEASKKGGHYTICSNRRFLPYVYRSELRQIFLFLMELSAMRVDHFQRDLRIIVLACALVLPSVSAFAQSGQLRFDSTTLAAAAQNAAQQSTEIVRRLTMDEAVKLALEQNLFNSFFPQLNSTLNLQVSQPLLRNFSVDQIRQQVQNSKKTRDLSDIQLQAVITQTMRNVRNAYWDLVYTINNLKAQQQSLALSQQFLRDNQKRVEIGTLAPIDIVQAQAEVASNESGVIVADAAIKTAQDNLRSLILDPGTADFWNIAFDPTDAASFAEQAIDVDAAVRNALDKRSDLRSAKNSLEQSDVNIRYFRNQVLPEVNANFNYITTASGGVQLSPVNIAAASAGLPIGDRSIVSDRGFGSVLGDVLGAAYPNWTVGVQIASPLGASTSHANLARAKLQYEQAQTQLKSLEMGVATQVRAVGRNVQTNLKRVQSARASRELQEKKLEAEEKKLSAGMSQSFFVFQAQRDLAVARVVEIQAISDYNKSLVDFEAVQEVPIGGGGGTITTAGSGAIQAGGSAIIRQFDT